MSKATTGLIAFGIVAGAFLVCGGGFAAVILSNRVRTAEPRPTSESPPNPATDPEWYVRLHRWWAQPLTQNQLDDFLRVVVNANAGTTVWFDNRLHYVVEKPGEDANVIQSLGTDRLTSIRVTMRASTGTRRWTRDQALAELIAVCDAAEFKYGPGRK